LVENILEPRATRNAMTFFLGVMAEALRAIICSKSAILIQWAPVDPKFQVKGVALTNHSFSRKN